MGRKKVEMKRIDDNNSRHVTFSKRTSGLIKEASALSALCTPKSLSSSSPVTAILMSSPPQKEKQLNASYQTYKVNHEVDDKKADKPKKHHPDCSGPSKVTELLEVMSNLEVEELTAQELTNLERDLGVILKQTRQRKTKLLMDTITSLAKKQKQLREELHQLKENQSNYRSG